MAFIFDKKINPRLILNVRQFQEMLNKADHHLYRLDLDLKVSKLRQALYSRITPKPITLPESMVPYFYDGITGTIHIAAGWEEETAASDAGEWMARGDHRIIWFFGDKDEMEQHIANRGRGI